MFRFVCAGKNTVITRQILQFQVCITFMGQWGKSTAQLLKLSSLQPAISASPLFVQEKMETDKIWDGRAVAGG